MAKKMKSILTNDLEHCYICGAPDAQIHHIFNAADKRKSEKYGLLMPLCMNHHTGPEGVHTIPGRMAATKELGQKMFELHYPQLNFLHIFKKNYIQEESKHDETISQTQSEGENESAWNAPH